jgi:hypothetical protein
MGPSTISHSSVNHCRSGVLIVAQVSDLRQNAPRLRVKRDRVDSRIRSRLALLRALTYHTTYIYIIMLISILPYIHISVCTKTTREQRRSAYCNMKHRVLHTGPANGQEAGPWAGPRASVRAERF